AMMSAPRTRGWTACIPPLIAEDRRPRARGDGPPHVSGSPVVHRSAPRARAPTVPGGLGHLDAAGGPAHAGMDPGPHHPHEQRERRPRARGDGFWVRWLDQLRAHVGRGHTSSHWASYHADGGSWCEAITAR